MPGSAVSRRHRVFRQRRQHGEQECEPCEDAPEVVADGGQDGVDGVDGVAHAAGEVVSAHAVVGFQVADDGLDGCPAAQVALDRPRHAAFLSGGVDLEAVGRRCVVAAVSGVRDDSGKRDADLSLDHRNDGRERMAVIGFSRLVESGPEKIMLPTVPPLFRTHRKLPANHRHPTGNHHSAGNAICKMTAQKNPGTCKQQYFRKTDLDARSMRWTFFTEDDGTLTAF